MSTGFGPDPEGATPLDDEQLVGLRQSWVTTREDLNQAEFANIAEGSDKWRRRVGRARNPLTLEHLFDYSNARKLHKDMFGGVWKWAGTWRQRQTNIGVAPWQVPEQTVALLSDATFWFKDATRVDDDAAQLHHRLVAIHPFPNGNGRFAREMADLTLMVCGRAPFSWGSRNLVDLSTTRADYIAALRDADRGDYVALNAFVRS